MTRGRSVSTFNWYDVERNYWLVRADTWQYPLKITPLPPGSDLIAAFLEEALAIHREGWRLRELTIKYGFFVAHRNVGREVLHVSMLTEDPRAKAHRPRQL